jgi:two-component system, sensor histidine kinase YesM
MKSLMKKFLGKNASLHRKVIVIYLLMAVFPIMIITLLASSIYYRSILNKAYALIDQNARQHETVVQERMDSYENVLYELVTNSDFISLAKSINVDNEDEILVDAAHMENLLRRSVYTYDSIRSITFLADGGRYITYSKWYGSNNEVIWKDERVRKNYHDEMGKEQKLTFITMVNISTSKTREDYNIMMGFPVRNLKNGEQSGVLVIALEKNVLQFGNNPNKNVDSGVTTVILDDQDKIIAGVDNKYINETYADYKKKVFGNVKRITESHNKIKGTSWTIENIIDTNVYRKGIYHFVHMVIFVTIGITCLFFSIVYLITRKYVNTIQKIAQGIHDYGRTDAEQIEIDIGEKDELFVIIKQFNKMTARVNSLVATLRKRNEEIKEAAVSQKNAEIKALEAQINPHFLFNTLDSINWRAIEHDEEEISDMLGALGSLLRYSVSNIDMVVVLEAEISWLKKYIFLQKDRFHNSFDCEYEISEDAMEFPIYKMLLQPIIENTILHAFENVKENGMIFVKAFIREEGKLEIRIRDNGQGMTAEKLADIYKKTNQKAVINSNSIGICNVVHRLRIYYQEEADIQVHTKLGEGTEFILLIPKQ